MLGVNVADSRSHEIGRHSFSPPEGGFAETTEAARPRVAGG
jgi:hypothetical protein